MAQIVGSPVFQDNVRQLEATDLQEPTTWNPNNEILIDNDVYLKQAVDAASAAGSAAASKVKAVTALAWAMRHI